MKTSNVTLDLKPSSLFSIALIVVASMTIGCGKLETMQRGGGARGIRASDGSAEAVYGTRDGGRLAFIVFTDITSDGTVASAGSNWSGKIAPTNGPTMTYAGSNDGIKINESEYKFDEGRVFLVSTKDDQFSITQLDLPIEDTAAGTEIDRLTETEELRRFLGR